MKRNLKISTTLQNTLDSALMHLYYAVRYFKGELLAIKFRYRGVEYTVDTAEEAWNIQRVLDSKIPQVYEEMTEFEAFWTPDRFVDTINGIGELQHRFLAAVFQTPGITSAEMVEKLQLKSEVALAGVISGLSKQLKQLGVEPRQVFLIDVKWTHAKKTRKFILDDFFKSAGAEQNWPDAWEQEKHLAEILS